MKKKDDIVYSEYQKKIFDFVDNGVGNAVVSAKAGSGKTKTLVETIKRINPKQKCLFLAFNKSIAEELSERVKSCKNATVRTSHSLGFMILRRNFGNEIEVNDYKYRTYIKSNIGELTTVEEEIKTKQQLYDYIDSISILNNFARLNYCQSIKEIDRIAKKYSIPIQYDECEIVQKVMKWGKQNTETIDYIDMIWLPVELSLKPLGLQFDWILLDEIQDFSVIMIELFQKCLKRGGRFIGVGDDHQMVNCFAGATEDAYQKFCNLPKTQIFELPICYRCDKNIINLAQTLVPDIQPREDADEGSILYDCSTNLLKEGDMVICRSKAPLVKLYSRLLRKKVNCYIKGQDIGSKLIKIIESIDKVELNPQLNKDGVFVRLYEKLFSDRNKLMQKRGLDFDDATTSSSIMEQYDNINTLLTLAGSEINNKYELIEHINSIFKENQQGICLSTIHKAKGLEADNVFVLCNSTLPSKLAQLDWEKKQEDNLVYVAYTRPKHLLGFISEREIKPCGSENEPMEIINDLMYIENKVCKILGTEPTVRLSNVDIAKFNLKNATEITDDCIGVEIHTIDPKVIDNDINFLEHLQRLIEKHKDDDWNGEDFT